MTDASNIVKYPLNLGDLYNFFLPVAVVVAIELSFALPSILLASSSLLLFSPSEFDIGLRASLAV
jgi:hypothetical protein